MRHYIRKDIKIEDLYVNPENFRYVEEAEDGRGLCPGVVHYALMLVAALRNRRLQGNRDDESVYEYLKHIRENGHMMSFLHESDERKRADQRYMEMTGVYLRD